MSRSACVLFVLAALAFPVLAAAQVIAPTPPIQVQQIQTFGMVGLASGQIARLNVLNPGVPAPLATAALCPARLTFLDSAGNVLKTESVSVLPGQSLSYDLNRDTDLTSTALRVQIRATIQMPPPAVATPTVQVVLPSLCTLFPTLEVFDASTGKTQVILESTRTAFGPVGILP
jgi:hypothetical protein